MSKQEQALVRLYKNMSTEEIQARVAGGELMPLAIGAAAYWASSQLRK